MTLSPPLAPRRRARLKSPKHLRDPWRWLENAEDPRTLQYLHSENAYYDAMTRPYDELKQIVYSELKSRLSEDDSSIPEWDADYWYYVRHEKGLQYPLYCRRKAHMENEEEIYLDHNILAKEHEFCELGTVDVSPDHRYVAIGIDTEGEERFQIRIKDTLENRFLDEVIENCSSCFEWKSSLGFFYVQLDELDRPNRVYFHRLHTPAGDDVLVYSEADAGFFVGLDSSESDAYIFVVCHGYDASETYAHAIDSEGLELQLIQERQGLLEYEVTHQKDRFLILSNDEAENFRLMAAPLDQPSRPFWKEVVAHREGVLLEGLVIYEKFFVLLERFRGKPRLHVFPDAPEKDFLIEFDEEAFEVYLANGRDFQASSFRYWYSSPRLPQTLYEYSLSDRQQQILKNRPIHDPQFAPELYAVKRVWAPSRDGQEIPVTLIYRTDIFQDQPLPMVLHSYGSYGEIIECDFSSYRISLVDRGFIYAMAHVRGGMEMGRQWYLKGKLEHKWNSFHDYIDVSEYLIAEGWTQAGSIIAEGASAGGLLVGVVANERPDLYLGVVASVPFVDVLNTMLDPELPLTTLEYKEWGHPDEAYELIKSYSPYDNVRKQDYPHMLVVASFHDKRVMYWEAAKWVAKLRSMKTDDRMLLLRIDMKAGHGGASGRYDVMREIAEELSFIITLKEKYLDSTIEKV